MVWGGCGDLRAAQAETNARNEYLVIQWSCRYLVIWYLVLFTYKVFSAFEANVPSLADMNTCVVREEFTELQINLTQASPR